MPTSARPMVGWPCCCTAGPTTSTATQRSPPCWRRPATGWSSPTSAALGQHDSCPMRRSATANRRRSRLTSSSVLRKRLLNRPLEPAAEQANRVGSAMAHNFLACDRDQAFLLPPDPRDWLPADHLVWFVLDVVDQLDLGPFLAAYRADGHGRAAYHPRMLLGVLLYAYATGIRSSRQVERRWQEDIAFRVLSG